MNKDNKTYHTICIGCQMNKSDTERLASYLDGLGYAKEDDEKKAGLIILMSCGVRQSAEDRIYGLIPRLRKANPRAGIILSGCLSDREDVREKMAGYVDIFLNIKDLPDLAGLLEGKTGISPKQACDYLSIMPASSTSHSVFIPIGNGCDNFCAYCVVPYARGRESYRNPDEIITEAKAAVAAGAKEITLIAQNVNSYRYGDSNIDFPDLLLMVNDIEGDFWLRFATSHPKDMSDKLIAAMTKAEKLCHHLHLPVQAGDDEILTAMNRHYKAIDYLGLIEKIRKAIPDIVFSTDIIVGFPGETSAQFENTKKLMAKVGFDMAYIAQYSPRPQTAAAKLDDNVSREEKRVREEELMDALRESALKISRTYIGKTLEVLVDSRNNKGDYQGKTKSFKSVRFKDREQDNLIGKIVKISIVDAMDFGLSGRME